MFASDPADTPLASCPAQEVKDSLRDLLLEPFRAFAGDLPRSHAAFTAVATKLVDAGIATAELEGATPATGKAVPQEILTVVVHILEAMSGDVDRHIALRALCYLRLLGHEGRSFQEIGNEFGVTRATVHAIYRTIQRRHPGLRSRGDKSDQAREACKQRRLGARKPKESWIARHLWNRPLSLIYPLPA